MKIGDLVICKYVDGKPVGVILNVHWRKVGSKDRIRIYDVFLNDSDFWGNTFPFQAHLLEVANESR
jgi:hypothetical protein